LDSQEYLNNIVEQDYRSIKRTTNPMMGFKSFHSAGATIAGIELYHMLKKGQHADAQYSTAFKQFYTLVASWRSPSARVFRCKKNLRHNRNESYRFKNRK
jgi:hypothetical protein